MDRIGSIILYLICLYYSSWPVKSYQVDSAQLEIDVIRMQQQSVLTNVEHYTKKYSTKGRSRRDLGSKDETCQSQEQRFLQELKTVKDEFSHVVSSRENTLIPGSMISYYICLLLLVCRLYACVVLTLTVTVWSVSVTLIYI